MSLPWNKAFLFVGLRKRGLFFPHIKTKKPNLKTMNSCLLLPIASSVFFQARMNTPMIQSIKVNLSGK